MIKLLALAGCNLVVMAPSGDIAMQQRDLIIVSTVLMLLIIMPVMFLTLFFAWRYRGPTPAPSTIPNGIIPRGSKWSSGRRRCDHHRARRSDLDQHPQARPLPSA
jgi:hypothetical protein